MTQPQSREPTLKPSNLPASAATASSPMDFLNKITSTPSPSAKPTEPVSTSIPDAVKTPNNNPTVVTNNTPNDPVLNAAVPVDPMKDILARIQAKKEEEARIAAQEGLPDPNAQINDGSDQIVLDDKPAEEETPQTAASTDETDEDLLDETKDPKVESVKKLRKVANEHKFKAESLQTELETTKAELEEFKTGKVTPEVLQQYEERIQELEKYEKVVALKKSKAYRKKIVEPLNKLGEQLEELSTKYGVDQRILHMAINTDDERERDQLLEDNFTTLAALEAKQVIQKMKGIYAEAREAEQEPVQILQKMEEEHKLIETEERNRKIEQVTQTTRNAWVKAHKNIVDKKLALELIPTDNPEFNQNVVQVLMRQASSEYTKVIKELVKNGAEISDDVAFAIAHAFQLAHSTPVAFKTRDEAMKHADTLEKNMKRTTSYVRPRIGQATVQSNGPGSPGVGGPVGNREAATIAARSLIDIGRQIAKEMPK